MDQPTVLVISDDVEFSRSITARWQVERHVPTFTLLSGDLWPRSIDNFSVAIVGPLRRELLSLILEPLHSTQQPLFCVCVDGATAKLVRERWPRTSVLRREENWLDVLILAAGEAVLRAAAEARARTAEEACATLERQASALGIANTVIFAGFVTDIRAVYAACDLFVFPSLQEGGGTSLLGAMACALPVILACTWKWSGSPHSQCPLRGWLLISLHRLARRCADRAP